MTVRRTRSTARLAFVVAVAIVTTLGLPYVLPASATHPPTSTLEVLEEVDTNPTGTTHTLTAQLFQGTTSTPQTVAPAGLPVNIDFEVETGPAIRRDCNPSGDQCNGGVISADGITPTIPDMTCDIQPNASSCTVVFTSDTSGTNLIRAFIDELRNNGGEASAAYDATEGRYSGPTDCGGRSTTPTGAGAGERCDFSGTTGTALPAQAGVIGEPDGTDVVQKTWGQSVASTTCIDVDPNSDTNASGTEHVITATVTTAATRTPSTSSDPTGDDCSSQSSPGLPRPGIEVDFSLIDGDTGITGSDDPNAFFSKIDGNSTGGSGGGPNTVTCTTGPQGTCNVTLRTVSATAEGDNFVIAEVPGATGGTGAGCTNTTFTGPTGGTGTGANNSCTAEVVRKTWVSATAVTGIDASPEEDTNEINTTHTVRARAVNALGTAVAGQTIIFDVTGGPGATRDIDNSLTTPAGFIGSCATDASGTCSTTYTSPVVGADTITACIDSNADFSCLSTENDSGNTTTGDTNDDQIIKHWVATGQGASKISLDMEGCNGSTSNPSDTASYQDSATPNDVSNDRNDAHAVCATVFNSANSLVRSTVTFTITGGPGSFVVPSSTNNTTFTDGSASDLGRSVTVAPGTCAAGAPGPGNAGTTGTGVGSGTYNCAFLLSDTTGSTVVSACVEGSTTICDTGTKQWQTNVQNARTVSVTPETATNKPGTNHEFTVKVTDRFGNVVPSVSVTWTRDGAGSIVSQENTTNTLGEARLVVTSSVEGTTTATAAIPGGSTDCDEGAGAPAGRESTTAGNCTDSGTKTWSEDVGTVPVTCRNRPASDSVIIGTSGADVLNGTGGRDIICGAGGNDVINARGGNDLIVGNGGSDSISGGGGKDNASGNDGEDNVSGNRGNDVLRGNAGFDTLKGGGGVDTLVGGGGNDTLEGGGKADILKGGARNDTLRGGKGDDNLDGGRGRDRCFGNAGRDRIRNCE